MQIIPQTDSEPLSSQERGRGEVSRQCWACASPALPGEYWCSAHDPETNPQSAAALDQLGREMLLTDPSDQSYSSDLSETTEARQ